MPYIVLDGPIMNKEQKKKIVSEFTKIASETLNLPKEAFTVLIRESTPDNVGVAGELLSEKVKKDK